MDGLTGQEKFSAPATPNQLVPSVQMKDNKSLLDAVVVSTGTTSLGHFTVPGQVAVRDPVPSCRSSTRKLLPAPAVGNVNVQFAVKVYR